jgi:subtilisin family serine protease
VSLRQGKLVKRMGGFGVFLAAIVMLGVFGAGRAQDRPATIVQFADEASKKQFLSANKLEPRSLTPLPGLPAYQVPKTRKALKQTAGSDVQPERAYKAMATPNDPIYPQWYTDKISAPTAWDISTGSDTVTVAVIDTGYALNHEDMAGRWATNAAETGGGKETNGVDDDSNGYIDDWRGWDFAQDDNNPSVGSTDPTGDYVTHGTIVAGLVGATGNNGLGVASTNWGSKILPIQALGDDGVGYTSDIAAAIRYAADRGAKVISLSLGSSEPDEVMRTQINYALGRGATVIAAAGNSGTATCGCMVYPANYPEVIAVGATDSLDVKASFSSYGPNLDLVAPGTGTIRTTYWSSSNQTSSYTTSASGTSIATPIVAGAAALLKSVYPSVTPSETEDWLTNSADIVSGMLGERRTDKYGYGRLNSYKALTIGSVEHPEGTLVLQDNKVYLLEAGQRRHVTSASIFHSHFYKWHQVKSATVQDRLLPLGTPIADLRPGTLVQESGRPEVWLMVVDQGSVKKQHLSYTSFVTLGYKAENILVIPLGDLKAQGIASVYTSTQHPDGNLIALSGDSKVYLVSGGQRHHVLRADVFYSYGYAWGMIKAGTVADRSLPIGSPVDYRVGTLISDNNRIYVVGPDAGAGVTKRHISSWNCFVKLGYGISEVIFTPAMPAANGAAVTC